MKERISITLEDITKADLLIIKNWIATKLGKGQAHISLKGTRLVSDINRKLYLYVMANYRSGSFIPYPGAEMIRNFRLDKLISTAN